MSPDTPAPAPPRHPGQRAVRGFRDRATPDPGRPAGGHRGSPESLPCVTVKLGRLLERRMRQLLRGHGVSAAQFLALTHIGSHPATSRADLARGIQVTPQAAGGITAQLLEMELVARTEANRGLPVAFTLTERGARLASEAASAMEALSREVLRFLRPDLGQVFDGAQRHLLDRLDR